MNKISSWLIGLAIGAAVGVILVALFSPISGEEVLRRLKDGFNETLDEAHRVAEAKRVELEAELAKVQKRSA